MRSGSLSTAPSGTRPRKEKKGTTRCCWGIGQPNHLIGYPKTKDGGTAGIDTRRKPTYYARRFQVCLGKQGMGWDGFWRVRYWALQTATQVPLLLQAGGEDPGHVSQETGGAGRGHSGLEVGAECR
jgi:hypothetical protein